MFFSKNKDKKSSLSDLYEDEELFNSASEELVNFDTEYFKAIEQGESFQQFLTIGGQQDCALIQSLLYSENIPSFVENQNVNRMYGGTPVAITGVFALKLYILTKDYDKAYSIICDYIKNKSENFKNQNEEKTILTTTTSIVTGLFFAPYPVNSNQTGMGITILPKVIKE